MTRDCLVVGAGVQGLCTAFWLARAGCRTTILDRFGPGHDRGSSHGGTRITRSSYDDLEFVRLASTANAIGWPTLEAALGQPLRLPTPGVFFGPPQGLFAEYLRTTLASGASVQLVDVPTARRRFPLLRFDAGEQVLVDDTAAVLLAAATMAGLRAWLAAAGVEFAWHTRVLGVHQHQDAVVVATDGGDRSAGHVVIAAGAGGDDLAADASPAPGTVLHQQVGYFDVEAANSATAPGAFPVWVRIGATAAEFAYGLPSVDDSGLKAAHHRTEGVHEDAEVRPAIDEASLRQLAATRFAVPVRSLRRSEPCLYTMLPHHRLVVARRPRQPRVVRLAACSGHAFKFAPELGRRAAALVLGVATEAACFDVARSTSKHDNGRP